ncbi:ATP-binding protein [Actinomadura litoris]|uniref:ATP-binding protein n=1 Tax=Actinomadura litoris TaxID=2678616 RepID=UPI001FA6B61A|nr:tetratricopeptide repeat protein [Actinomadura litoris]
MPDSQHDRTAGGTTHSALSGNTGDVVQARDVSGGIHFHYGRGSHSAPQELPHGVRVFVNRVDDLEQLDHLVSARRAGADDSVVAYVIAGTAGVGKTSLALHWAHRVREEFPDGQLYVDLRGYDPGAPLTPDQALERFLVALGVPASAIPNDVEAKSNLYRSILADRQMLVILDNAGTTGQVRPLIPGAGPSLAIVTSRSRLSGLLIRDGAQRTTLETLDEAESVRLLIETTSDYRSGDDPADIAELARLCAHLPLALRIAAERAAARPAMPLSELIADLRDESSLWDALSTGDESDADAVRTVFAWSYRALPEQAARLFCLLGLHPGGDFSEAAASVLAGPESGRVRGSLDVLTGAYLLEARGGGRYQFHDLLRAYAVDRARYEIPQKEQLDAVERICAWYLHSAYQCVLSLAHDTTLLFTLEPSPEAAALTFGDRAQAAQWYADEKANLVGAVRAAAETDRPELAWRLALVLERLYATFNHFQDWQVTSLLGLSAAQALGARKAEAALCESLGLLCRMTLRLDEADGYLRAAIAIHRDLDDRLSTVKTLNGLGWVNLFAHRLERARADLEEALSTVRDLDDPYWTATVRFSLGYTLLQLGRPDDATGLLTDSLATFRELDDRLYESTVLTAFSLLERRHGETAKAVTTAAEAVAIAREMENPLWEGTALLYLGKAELADGSPEDALVSTQRAAVIFRQEGEPSREAMALDGTGRAYSALDRAAEAADFHRRAAAVHRQAGDRWKHARSLTYLADALEATGDLDEALRRRREAAAILDDYDDPRSVALRTAVTEA